MHPKSRKIPELLYTTQTKTLFFPWINIYCNTIPYSILHPMKQFITSSAFCHLLIKQFALQFSSCYTKLQNNITVTIASKHLLIGLSH